MKNEKAAAASRANGKLGGRPKNMMEDPLKTWLCGICKKRKLAGDFYINHRRNSRLSGRCKSCEKKRDRKEYFRDYVKNERKTHPEKLKARQAVQKHLKKEPCMVCKSEKTDAHHYLGYEKENWLNVQWLCRKHHALAHASMRAAHTEPNL